ncbi:Tripartite motif-containing protein 16 [Collichthys lucidus]|uniref:Tripartite motif-containing protein 16 n=1 Tax=Collichthys lucidus TaxID=240159 RepID=A0A4U5V0E1_COLLU|nr:Tripartite motif-containing protein 16 [Collichthys lucidus]
MAQAGVVLDKDQFNCPICLDVLRDPVTIPCGHSYCSGCIQNYWDQDDYLGIFVCPQCRQNFNPRPPLARNTMLADVVERFKKTGLQETTATTSNQSLAQDGDVECDVCTGRKNKAVRSCLVCLASYCDLHVQPHYESAAFKKHKLVSATKHLQETICGRHDKLLEVYCRTDKQCICYLCLTDEHKGHDTVLVEAEIQQKQTQLGDMKQSSQLRIHQREKEAQELRQAIFSLTRSARTAAEESDAIFTELIRSIELKRFEVRELIKAQEKTAVSQAEQVLEKIQKEIAELKKNEAELDKLSHTEDHVHFLQSCESLQAPPTLSVMPSVSNLSFGPVMTAVADFKGLLQEVCQGGFVCIYDKVRDVVIVGPPNPAAQLNTTQPSDGEAAVQMEATHVCLEILKDPATIPCGHSYCLDCIEDYWNRAKQKGQYSCPQCRQVFNPRPLLSRNTVLGEVVEKFKQSESSAQHVSKAEEVKCSICTGRKTKAVKSCLACSDSYCVAHLRVHEERFHGKAHKLIPASDQPREKLCPQHDKSLRLYCRTDQQHVCSQCIKERHKSHDTVSVVDERATQQKKLQETSLKSVQKLKDMEKELRYVVRYIKHSTEAVVEESERIFSKLIRSIEKQSCEVKELIRVQERATVSQAEELLEKIQREIVELRRAEAELEKLSRTEDHVHFLQKCKSLHFPVKPVEMPSTDALPYLMYKSMRGALADLRDSLDETLERDFKRISDKVISLKEASNQNTSERTKDYNDITLDPNTANPYLSFSDGRRGVTTRSEPLPYQDHPARFTNWAQVLCKAGMAGRCYWEVEWSGKGGVSIGLCYKNMGRSGGGSDCKIGHNSKSWSLDCSYSVCSFQHNKESVALAAPCGSRIGVYLDFRGGTLSFYNVSDAMVLLHKVKTTFNQPVFPGFWVGLGSSLKLCSL